MRAIFLFFLILGGVAGSIAQPANYAKIDSLSEIFKVWGYLKYHAPDFTNYDEQFFDLINHKKSVNLFINEVLNNISASKSLTKQDEHVKENLLCRLSNDWIWDCILISDVNKKLLFSIVESKNEKILIEKTNFLSKNLLKKSIESVNYPHDTANNLLFLLGISKLWNYLNYFYPHRCSLSDFDSCLIKSLRIYFTHSSYNSYVESISYLLTSLNDPHTTAFFNYPRRKTLLYKDVYKVFPINVLATDKYFIINRLLYKDIPLSVGDTILSINNRQPNMFFINATNLKSIDTLYQRHVINCTKLDSLTVVCTNNGIKRTCLFQKDRFISLEQWLDINFEFDDSLPFISDNILYINCNTIQSRKQLQSIKLSINKFDSLIIDLRGYPKSNLSNEFVECLTYPTDQPSRYLIYQDYSHPGTFFLKPIVEKGSYKGGKKIYVLINNFTQSWSETLALILAKNKDVTFIGQNTGNALGQVDFVLSLPPDISVLVTDIGQIGFSNGVNYPFGIIPDYRINYINTAKEIKEIIYKR
jgi:hypothetical protein